MAISNTVISGPVDFIKILRILYMHSIYIKYKNNIYLYIHMFDLGQDPQNTMFLLFCQIALWKKSIEHPLFCWMKKDILKQKSRSSHSNSGCSALCYGFFYRRMKTWSQTITSLWAGFGDPQLQQIGLKPKTGLGYHFRQVSIETIPDQFSSGLLSWLMVCPNIYMPHKTNL